VHGVYRAVELESLPQLVACRRAAALGHELLCRSEASLCLVRFRADSVQDLGGGEVTVRVGSRRLCPKGLRVVGERIDQLLG